MTIGALAGLLVLNAVYIVVGSSVLWALGAWRERGEYVRIVGLAYFVGLSALGTAWTVLLVAGVPFGGWTIALTTAAVVGGALVVRRPGQPEGATATLLGLHALAAAVGVAAAGVFLEALFRAARLHALVAFDAWFFWVPKAKSIYFSGGLDEQVLAQLPNATYPPLLPILDAAGFHAMGSADVVTLHVQHWSYAVAMVLAVAGLLWHRVAPWMLWPVLLLALAAPRMTEHLLTPQADLLLQYLFALATLLAALWLVDAAGWRLAAVSVLLAGVVLTKREGVLLAAIVLVALVVAAWGRRETPWRRTAAIVPLPLAASLSWWIWYQQAGLGGTQPSSSERSVDRALDAARLSLEVVFDPGRWSLVTILGATAVVLAAVWGSRRLAVLFGVVFALVVLGGVGAIVAFPELPVTADEAVNPIVRYTGAVVWLSVVAAPLLLAGVWKRSHPEPERT